MERPPNTAPAGGFSPHNKTMSSSSLFSLQLLVVLLCSCSEKKSTTAIQIDASVHNDAWTLYEFNDSTETYGGWHTSDDAFYTSGGESIWRRVGTEATEVYHRSNVKFHDLLGDSADTVWSVGSFAGTQSEGGDYYGLITSCDKEDCQDVGQILNYIFYAIAVTPDDFKYIAGYRYINSIVTGVILGTQDGTNIDTIYFEREGFYFNNIWVDQLDDFIAATGRSLGGSDDYGTIVIRGEDGIWKEPDVSGDEFVFSSVWGTSPNEVFFVGQCSDFIGWMNGGPTPLSVVYKYDGNEFKEVLRSSDTMYNSVWGLSSDEIYLGGQKLTLDGNQVQAATRIVRWDQKTTYEAVLPAERPDNSIIYGFDNNVDESKIYAYTCESAIYENIREK